MARTHTFPADSVHYTWDAGNAPALTIESGDTVVLTTRDVSDGQFVAGGRRERVRRPGLGPLVSPRRARSPSTARSRGTRSRSRSSTCRRRAGAGRRSSPASACSRRTSPTPTCASSTSRPATRRTCARTSAFPSSRSSARWACALSAPTQQRVMPPGVFGGNIDTRQLTVGSTLYLPVQVAGRPVQLRRRARRPGRRRGLRDRNRGAHGRDAAVQPRKGSSHPGAAVPDDRAAHASRRRRGLLRHDGRRARSVRRRRKTPCGPWSSISCAPARSAGRTPTCSRACASTSRSRRSSTRASSSSAPCCRWPCSATRRALRGVRAARPARRP